MPASEFDREELPAEQRASPARQPEAAGSQDLEWASAVGNSAVQRIARSATGRRAPVGPGAMPLAAGVLARQADEEEEGEGTATATAEPEPAEAAAPEAAEPEAAAPEAAPESEGEEPLEEEMS